MNSAISIRTCRPGDPSLVCYFYYKLFEQQYHFNSSVEAYFIHSMSELFDDPEESRLWVAEREGEIVGCIAIIKKGAGEAQLRLFGVSPSLQGLGVGSRLIETAMRFCEERRYSHILLWTIDILKSARHLYARQGFVMTETKPNTDWTDHEILE